MKVSIVLCGVFMPDVYALDSLQLLGTSAFSAVRRRDADLGVFRQICDTQLGIPNTACIPCQGSASGQSHRQGETFFVGISSIRRSVLKHIASARCLLRGSTVTGTSIDALRGHLLPQHRQTYRRENGEVHPAFPALQRGHVQRQHG